MGISLTASPLANSLAGFAREGIWRLYRSPALESRQLRRLPLTCPCTGIAYLDISSIFNIYFVRKKLLHICLHPGDTLQCFVRESSTRSSTPYFFVHQLYQNRYPLYTLYRKKISLSCTYFGTLYPFSKPLDNTAGKHQALPVGLSRLCS